MCEESLLQHFGRTNLVTRRHLGALSAAGGASLLLPRAAAALEVYAGTRHSWCTADSPVHDPEQAERAWGRMFELFERRLKA